MSQINIQPLPDLSASMNGAQPDAENEAALRQFTLQRLMGYGVEYGDAVHLRSMVAAGATWQRASVALAEAALDQIAKGSTTAPRRNLSYRASALLRMSQMMMLTDSHERRTTYQRAADLFAEAGKENPGWIRITIPDGPTRLAGWLLASRGGASSTIVVVIGGVEGWAMDWESLGRAFADRGLATLLLDGPGQGESRFQYGSFLTIAWKQSMSCVLDDLQSRRGIRSIGVLGHSMGGTFAMHVATDPRIAACCNNGGFQVPALQKTARKSFYPKLEAFCGTPDAADEVWGALEIKPDSLTFACPFLIVQGGSDPFVTIDESKRMLHWAASSDKQVHVFADGDHCIYNHPADRNNLIGDWFVSRLSA